MYRVFSSLVISFLCVTSALAATTGSRSGTVAAQAFSINGVACPEVLSWSGGNFTATIVTNGGNKHVANITIDPITAETTLPLSPALAACVSDLCAHQSNPKTLQLTNLDANGAVVDAPLQALNAQLMEVHFPALDSNSRDPLRLTLVFITEQIRPDTAAPAAAGRRMAQPSVSNFHVSISGLDASRVSRIEPFIISRPPPASSIGVLREPTTQPGSTDFPNLGLIFGDGAPADWKAWRDDFFVNGHHLDADEKDGSLQILAADLKTVLFSLKLSHIGLLRFVSQPDANNLPNHARVDLYCEQMTVGTDTTIAPSSSTIPTTNPATTTPATVTNPADQGARDPANFARPPNTIRTAYSATNNQGVTEEEVKYTSTSTSDDLHAFYTKYFGSAGWAMAELHENDGGPNDVHQIYGHWTDKYYNSVDLRLIDVKPGDVEITVNLKRSPPPDPRT